MKFSTLATFALGVGALFGANVAVYAQNLSGAIFTTVSDGTAVNANIYNSKCSVYLDGGPGAHAPAHAAGLPDGDYYFQVTDPSGKQLLSTDPASNRRFTVKNGVIVAYVGTGGPIHPIGLDQIHPELGAITIQLANSSCPTDFADSPNNGGAYKVWVTPVTSFAGDPAQVDNACGNGCYHGFLPSQSKTDNFKATLGTPTFCIAVQKQILQADGITVLPGVNWNINITDPLGVINAYYTDSVNGQLQVCGLTAGSYTVTENLGGTANIGLTVNGASLPAQPTYSFVWSPGQPGMTILFLNQVLLIG